MAGRSISNVSIMKKFLIPSAAVAAAPIVAKSKDSQEDLKSAAECGKESPKMVKPSELPVYEQLIKPCKPVEPEPPRTELEEAVSVVRKELWVYVDGLQHYKQKIVEYVETGKAHTEFIIDFLKEEQNYLPRAGAIGLGGLTGLVLGLRGGVFRRLLYGSGGAAAMASLCYPREATEYSKEAVHLAKKYAQIGYNFAAGVKPEKAESEPHMGKRDPTIKDQKTSHMVNISPNTSCPTIKKVDASKEQVDSLPPITMAGTITAKITDSNQTSPKDHNRKGLTQFLSPVTLPPAKLIHKPISPGPPSESCSTLPTKKADTSDQSSPVDKDLYTTRST